jgi:hexosaminidase
MTDGLMGTNSYKTGWQGYEGTDIEFTVDLLQPTKINSVKLNFVKSPSDWVLYPTEVVFSISLDGKTWKNLDPIKFDATSPSQKEIKPAGNNFRETEIRYIKVRATSPKVLPEWHTFKGKPCWIFCDELVVE